MNPARTLFLGAAFAAAAAFGFSNALFADDAAPAAPAATPAPVATPAPAADAPKPAETAKPETKTSSPIHSMMGWVAKQVAPNCECGCPGTEDGGKAWTAWFAGGKDVPLAGLRDAMVADGWNADRTITYFKEMAAKKKASGDCASKCGEGKKGDCAGKCGEGKKGDCAGKCGEGKTQDAPVAPPADKPVDAPKLP